MKMSANRDWLETQLRELPPAQFQVLVSVLKSHPWTLPPLISQDDRADVLAWAEGSDGCGLEQLRLLLLELLATGNTDISAEAKCSEEPQSLEYKIMPVMAAARGVSIGGNATGGVIVTGNENKVVMLSPAKPIRGRHEQLLLESVKDQVEQRLNSSLHGSLLLEMKKRLQPDKVTPLYAADVKAGPKPETSLLGVNLPSIFERKDISGKLLVLGEPGAGKTIALLELALWLTERALEDTELPVPALFDLADWKDDQQAIDEWLAAMLKSKYGLGLRDKKLNKALIEERRIVPILDGLDEVELSRQRLCLAAINRFIQGEQAPRYLVLASRIEEYGLLTDKGSDDIKPIKLALNGAVRLEPLSKEQIKGYLEALGASALWTNIANEPQLLDLLKTPLYLSMFVRTFGEGEPDRLVDFSREGSSLDLLFKAYIDGMFERSSGGRGFSPAKVKQYLGWLARTLNQQGQSELLLERMQPEWLTGVAWKIAYALGSEALIWVTYTVLLSLVGIALFVIYNIFSTAPQSVLETFIYLFGVAVASIVVIIAAVLGTAVGGACLVVRVAASKLGLIKTGIFGCIKMYESLKWSRSSVWQTWESVKSTKLMKFYIASVIFYNLLSLALSLGRELLGWPIKITPSNILDIFFGSIPGTMIAGLLTGILMGWLSQIYQRLDALPRILIWCYFLFGPLSFIYSCWQVGVVDWRFTAAYGLPNLLMILPGWFLAAGIRFPEIERRDRPNQGIGKTVRASIVVGAISFAFIFFLVNFGARLPQIMSITLLSFKTEAEKSMFLQNMLFFAQNEIWFDLAITFAYASLISMHFAGNIVRHYTLRAFLIVTGRIPCRFVRFLDDATEMMFLQRVGGRYRFIHRLLQEYFAGLS